MRFLSFLVVTSSLILFYQNCASDKESFSSASCSGSACAQSSDLRIELEEDVDPSLPVRIQLSPDINNSTGACIEFLPIYQQSDACDWNVISYPISNHIQDWTEVERGIFVNSSFVPLSLNMHGIQANFYAQRSHDSQRTLKSFRIKSVLEVPLLSLGDNSFHWYSSDLSGLNSVLKISRQRLPVYTNVFRLFSENDFPDELIELCLYREGMDEAKPSQGHVCDRQGQSFTISRDAFTNKNINGRNGHHSNIITASSLPSSITRIETYVKKVNHWIQLSSIQIIP